MSDPGNFSSERRESSKIEICDQRYIDFVTNEENNE